MSSLWSWMASWPTGALVLVDVLSSVATAVAAVLAAVTIVQAKRQAAEAQRALIHERQIDHRLDLLMDLADNNPKSSGVAFVEMTMRQRASLLPVELVPITRAALGLETTEDLSQLLASTDGEHASQSLREILRTKIDVELQGAIERTLSERPPNRPGITAVSRRQKATGNR